MRIKAKKHKIGSTKPASQLFLFSRKLNTNIDSYFSGNIVFETKIDEYDYAYHSEAWQVMYFMMDYCIANKIEPYRYLTIVTNYQTKGLTLAKISGEYHYPIAVHGLEGYKNLEKIYLAYEDLKMSDIALKDYRKITNRYARLAMKDPTNMSPQVVKDLRNELSRNQRSINKRLSSTLNYFTKAFEPKNLY